MCLVWQHMLNEIGYLSALFSYAFSWIWVVVLREIRISERKYMILKTGNQTWNLHAKVVRLDATEFFFKKNYTLQDTHSLTTRSLKLTKSPQTSRRRREPRNWGGTEALVTAKLHALSLRPSSMEVSWHSFQYIKISWGWNSLYSHETLVIYLFINIAPHQHI